MAYRSKDLHFPFFSSFPDMSQSAPPPLPPSPARRRNPAVWIIPLVLGILALLGAGVFVFVKKAMEIGMGAKSQVEKVISDANAQMIRQAVEAFAKDHNQVPLASGVSPAAGGSLVVTDEPAGVEVLNILYGTDSGKQGRGVRYLVMQEVSPGRKGGLAMDASRKSPTGAYDESGHPFHIVLDTNGDGELVVKLGDKEEKVSGMKCLVFSAGADGKLGTPDDVRSW